MRAGPRRAADVSARDLGEGEFALLHVLRGQVLLLNAIGGAVWQLCDGTRSEEDIAHFIAANVRGADLESVRADVAKFLAHLQEAGCLEEAP